MKKKYIAILAASLLLFSACEAGKESGDSSAAIPQTPDAQQSSLPAEEPSVAQQPLHDTANNSSSATDLPIDITTVFYDDEIDWASTRYQYDQNSFEMPDSWVIVDGEQHGLLNGVFLVPPDTDMDDFRFRAHVAVEVMGSKPEGAQVPDFSSEEIQQQFFAAEIISTYSKMGGLSDLEFFAWESEQSYVYIARFKRSNEQISMYQTTYYVMNPDKLLTVQASHFGEDADPEVNEVARHLINTFA